MRSSRKKRAREAAEELSPDLVLLDLAVYGGLMVAYLVAVLELLSPWLLDLAERHTWRFASVSLVLVVAQAVLLEAITTLVVRLVKRALR